jgi:hypothetical protein
VNGVTIGVRVADATTEELPKVDVAVANISLAVIETLVARLDARSIVTSGYLESDEPDFGPYVRRERSVRDGWAADVIERAE